MKRLMKLLAVIMIMAMILCSCGSEDNSEKNDTNSGKTGSTVTNVAATEPDSATGTESTAVGSTSAGSTEGGSTAAPAVTSEAAGGSSAGASTEVTGAIGVAPDSEPAPDILSEGPEYIIDSLHGGDSTGYGDYGIAPADGAARTEDAKTAFAGETDYTTEAFIDGAVTDSYDTSLDMYIDEPEYKPYIPSVQPGAHMLTAAEWNDNKNFDFIRNLLRDNNGYEYFEMLKEWNMNPLNRIKVTCLTDNGAAENALVRVYAGEEVIWTAKTDNSGVCYCFCNFRPYEQEKTPTRVEAIYNGKTESRDIASANEQSNFEDITLNMGERVYAGKKLELMLVLDTTGSMGDEISFLQCELANVIERIKAANDNLPIALSVNFYKDNGDEYVVRPFPFSSDIDTQVHYLMNEYAMGGGDYEEAVEKALDDAVSNHEWSEDATKILFLVLDAPPHKTSQVSDVLAKVIPEAAMKGIRIVPVAASGVDKDTEFLLRTFAMATGGTYTFLTNDSGIGGYHIEATVGDHEVEYLNDLMVRVASNYLTENGEELPVVPWDGVPQVQYPDPVIIDEVPVTVVDGPWYYPDDEKGIPSDFVDEPTGIDYDGTVSDGGDSKLPTRDIDMYGKHVSEDEICEHDGIFYAKNQLLVTVATGTPKENMESLFDSMDADVVGYISITDDYQIEFRHDTTYDDLMMMQEKLLGVGVVEYVSLNYVEEITLGVE